MSDATDKPQTILVFQRQYASSAEGPWAGPHPTTFEITTQPARDWCEPYYDELSSWTRHRVVEYVAHRTMQARIAELEKELAETKQSAITGCAALTSANAAERQYTHNALAARDLAEARARKATADGEAKAAKFEVLWREERAKTAELEKRLADAVEEGDRHWRLAMDSTKVAAELEQKLAAITSECDALKATLAKPFRGAPECNEDDDDHDDQPEPIL